MSLAAGFSSTPERVRDAWSRVHQRAAPRVERRLAPGLEHDVSEQALRSAAALIPRHARFAVVVGDDPPLDPAVQAAARVFLRTWLLPRVYVPRPQDADWVVTYHS